MKQKARWQACSHSWGFVVLLDLHVWNSRTMCTHQVGLCAGRGVLPHSPPSPSMLGQVQKLLALERAPGARFGCYGFVVSDASSSALAMFVYWSVRKCITFATKKWLNTWLLKPRAQTIKQFPVSCGSGPFWGSHVCLENQFYTDASKSLLTDWGNALRVISMIPIFD